MDQATRLRQRLNNYHIALERLDEAVEISQQRPLSNLEQLGLIQTFEFTHELACDCLKGYLQHQGDNNIIGSRDATKKALSFGLITEGQQWIDMIDTRHRTLYAYKEDIALHVSNLVINHYHPLLKQLDQQLNRRLP
ncbi:MAG: nucleotidyltransferase [Gammaproteobacteria bacterium]|nr:MAG: nucleotidyltransferase [Gammaproteobacteria bacterium]